MSNRTMNPIRPFTMFCCLALVAAIVPLVSAQVSTIPSPNNQNLSLRSVPNGSRMKFQGVVMSRDADTFTIRDRSRADYQVLINDNTSIKTNGGFLRSGKKYPVTDILRGLIVEVEGRGDSQGQLVADKIRFNESDMRAAITSDTRVSPVEENQKAMSGQMDELYSIAAEARQQVTAVKESRSAPDDYYVQGKGARAFSVKSPGPLPAGKPPPYDLPGQNGKSE